MSANRALSAFLINHPNWFQFKWSIIQQSFYTPNSDEYKKGMHAVFNVIEAFGTPEEEQVPQRDLDLDPYTEEELAEMEGKQKN